MNPSDPASSKVYFPRDPSQKGYPDIFEYRLAAITALRGDNVTAQRYMEVAHRLDPICAGDRVGSGSVGMVNHNRVFFTAVGEPFVNTFLPYRRWTDALETLPLRYRKPYNSRHSFISWRLMVGHNRLLVAQDDGHSVATMEQTYAA